jgi:hypothetical protein
VSQGGYTSYNAVHEFGHFFDVRAGTQPRNDWAEATVAYTNEAGRRAELPKGRSRSIETSGFGSVRFPWEQNSKSDAAEEVFADMFLGWTYNHFAANEAGAARYDWMETHMAGWIARASR